LTGLAIKIRFGCFDTGRTVSSPGGTGWVAGDGGAAKG